MMSSLLWRKVAALAPALAVLAASTATAAVKPNSLFCDGAVLQQGISVPVWGTADEGEKVTVEFNGQTVSATAGDGKWMVRLKPMRSGGPYTMTISGTNRLELKNVLVGEVWICSGQSNMQMLLKECENAERDIVASTDPMLRLFTVPRNPQDTPAAEVDGSWTECGPETANSFSAVGYFFGRDLRKTLNVPVGLINTSYSGTRVQAWTSARLLDNFCALRWRARQLPNWATNPNKPAALYNGMIAPLIPYAIRGAIWYQGESNAAEAFAYRTLFPTMIRNWREDWGQGDFPFLFVQIAPFRKINPEPEESDWAELREAQLLTSLNYPGTAMAVITDAGDPDNIHPTRKEPVGARLALAAHAIAYGRNVPYQGPTCKEVKIRGSQAILSFDTGVGGLVAKDGELKGFTIAGEDRKFYNAAAEIRGNSVVVSSPRVSRPAAVRYGWANCPVVNLFNDAGLPASPFRTDDFPMLTEPREAAN